MKQAMEGELVAGGGLINLAIVQGGLIEELHVQAPGCGATGWRSATRLRGSFGGPFPMVGPPLTGRGHEAP